MNPIDLALKIIRNEAEELWRNGDVVEEDKEYMFGEALATVVSGMVDRIDGSCSLASHIIRLFSSEAFPIELQLVGRILAETLVCDCSPLRFAVVAGFCFDCLIVITLNQIVNEQNRVDSRIFVITLLSWKLKKEDPQNQKVKGRVKCFRSGSPAPKRQHGVRRPSFLASSWPRGFVTDSTVRPHGS